MIPFVWPCQESTVDARRSFSVRPCFSRSRSTASVASSTAWLRVARTATSGSVGSSPGDHCSTSPVGRAGVVVARGLERESGREELVEELLDEVDQRQVDVGRLGLLEPVDLKQHWTAGRDLRPDGLCDAGCPEHRHRPVAGRSDAVEFAPLGVERAPERQLRGRRPPDGRKFGGPGPRRRSSNAVGHAR